MNVLLGVGGGIAAYKAAELARLLVDRGHTVQAVMTDAAQEFLRPLTLAALTGRKVITAMFGSHGAEDVLSSSIEHIRVAQENDVLAVAPATADLLAKFAHGLAGDFLTTTFLAFKGPVVLAPAMNTHMWEHPATQHNVAILRARGCWLVGPEPGPLACGMTGVGRLADPQAIADRICEVGSTRRDLSSETILITAGPTQEPLDPVRYISNRSSGKMGYALAEVAVGRGARVILVSGPVHISPPGGVELVPVRTALEMRQAVLERLAETTMVVKAAAVADYYVAQVPVHKVKKTAMRMSITLEPTPDILAEVGEKKGDRILIGFAAETENLLESARKKLETKRCDMVVANLVGESVGFESDENEVLLVMSSGETVKLPRASKRKIAEWIFDHALRLRLALHSAG